MEQTTIIILVLGALIFGALIAYVLVRSGQKQASNRPDEAFLLLQNQLQGFQVQMGELLKTVDSKMGES